jgi:tetratricopeptide (TPR) repeat protein|tara:strand:+ start:3110 stop:3955 length:846 start_codon:yes stop_codon:yes gene_type:complete
MTKSKRYEIQQSKYKEILTYNSCDFFAMKCLIEIHERLGDKPQAKKYKSKLTTLKNEWIANYKTTENGEKLDKRFKKITNGQIHCRKGQLKNWNELWLDLINGADIDCVEFHFHRSQETKTEQRASVYLEISELINDNGDTLNEIIFESELNLHDIDEALKLCVILLESNPKNGEALKFFAKYCFHNLSSFPIEHTLQQFDELYLELKGWSDPEILLYRGIIYACIGEIQKALKMLKKILKIERRAEKQQMILNDIPEEDLPSKKLGKIIAGIIKQTETTN